MTPDEFVLRTIPNTKEAYDPENAPDYPVQHGQFYPTNKKRDPDGLSFFREDFISPKRLAEANSHGAGVYVTKLLVADLLKLGLTVEPSTDEKLPGHVIIPQMNYAAYKKEKKRVKDSSVELARLASKGIVYGPSRPRSKAP